MSEPKRATLSTISTSKSDVKKVKETSKTIRFSLNLPESNEKSCPEYNYRDLLNSAEKKNKLKEKPKEHPNGFNNLDPFNDDDDSDVKRIAAKFEQKYGLPPTKKRRNKKDDYADIGAGYDESDSFIDNTDAYDEMVPEDVTTLHGGFYINSGALEFKTVELSGSESSDTEPEDKTEKSVNRKRIMEDSDETDSEEEKLETKSEHIEKKQKIETNGVQKPAKKKILLDDKDILIKKKKIDENVLKKKQITVKDLLREKREEFDMTIEPVVTETEKVSDQKDLKPTNNTITDVIESVVNAGRVTAIVDEISKDNSSLDSVTVVTPTVSDSECSRDGVPAANRTKEPSQTDSVQKNNETEIIQKVELSDNLPANVLEIINNIKKAAENSDEHVNLFTRPFNTMLLNLQIQCRKLSKSTRNNIFEYLAAFVKCQPSTLSRRAKDLVIANDKDKALKKLKVIVDETMPIVMKSYEKEFQKHRDEMFQLNANANAENGEANPKARRAPRKKYPWSDNARRALYDVILYKKDHFVLDMSREETFESMLDAFLKAKIIPLWPDGWMSFVAISKQVKSILEIIQKTKIPVNTTPMSPISLDISTTINSAPPFTHSPVMKLSPSSAITMTPIPPKSLASPKAAALNGPKKHHSPTIPTTTSVVKPADMSITTKKSDNPASVLSLNPEISIVTTNSKDQVPSSLLIPSNKSVSVTSVDLRTNQLKPISKLEEEEIVVPVKTIIPVVKSKRIETPDDNDECQIIDLTDSPVVIRKAGPKSKTRVVDGLHHKHKRVKELKADEPSRRNEEISGTQALNQIITGLTRTSSAEVKTGYKETEDEMEQVMKDLKELQQLQEHARKNEIDIMAPSSSPVSVIAFNSNYSSNSRQPSDLSTKDRKTTAADGFQELYQKHLYGDVLKSSNQSTSVYNSNVQPKNNFNSINNFSYSATGSISNPMNNIRYSQNPSKYTAPISHLPPTATGATNHTDDFALFQNFLYQYGFHNASGSKQKSPP